MWPGHLLNFGDPGQWNPDENEDCALSAILRKSGRASFSIQIDSTHYRDMPLGLGTQLETSSVPVLVTSDVTFVP